jgi:hypothetical protein
MKKSLHLAQISWIQKYNNNLIEEWKLSIKSPFYNTQSSQTNQKMIVDYFLIIQTIILKT